MRPLRPIPPGDESRLEALTSLRFVAAFLVVLYHIEFAFAPESLGGMLMIPGSGVLVRSANSALEKSAGLGSLGPNLFFVLSGFILYWAYVRTNRLQSGGTRSFYVARVARLYPVYLVALLLAVVAMLTGTTCPDRSAACLAGRNPLTVIASIPMLQGWLPWTASALNAPAWTLSTELLFYLSFPLVARYVARLSNRATWITLAASLLLTQAWLPISLLLGPKPPTYDGSTAAHLWTLLHFAPPMHLAEFIAGVSLGKLFVERRLPAVTNGYLQLVILTASVLTVMVLSKAAERIPGFDVGLAANNGLFDAVFCVVIVVLASGNRLMHRRGFIALGEASFSMYILHWPIWYLLAFVWPLPATTTGGFLFLSATYVLVLVSLSLGSVRFLERPARRRIQGAWNSRRNMETLRSRPASATASASQGRYGGN